MSKNNTPIKKRSHLPLALFVFRAVPRSQLPNGKRGIICSHPTELMAGRRIFATALLVLIATQITVRYPGLLGCSRTVGVDEEGPWKILGASN